MTNNEFSRQPGKNYCNLQRKAHYFTIRLFSSNSTNQDRVGSNIQTIERKNHQPKLTYPVDLLFRYDAGIRTFTDIQKVREFSTTRPPLQEILKEAIQTETKSQNDPKKEQNC